MTEDRMPGGDGTQPAALAEPKLIKRYVNRKYYDTEESRYVTLDEIAHVVRAGREVKILDNASRMDITTVALVQILSEEVRRASNVGQRTLCDLIRNGSRLAAPPLEVATPERPAERSLRVLVARGRQASDRAREIAVASRRAVAELDSKLSNRVGAAFEIVGAIGKAKRELARLAGHLDELDKRLRDLDGSSAATC